MTRHVQSENEIVFECHLDEPPERVWRALTERELREAWMATDDQRTPRERQPTEFEVLEAEPHRLLRFACRDRDNSGDVNAGREQRVVESTVTFELSRSETGGTHLRLVHSDFRVTREVQAHGTVCSLASARVNRAKKMRVVSCLASYGWREAA